MSRAARDPALGRLADAILIPPFPGLRAPSWVLAALRGGLGGVTLYGPNIAGPAQLGELVARLRAASAEPVIAIDEEGGDVTRIAHRSGSPYPGNAALGAVDDPELTEAVYRALGAELAALGANLNLAPSVDVNTAADNPVIGTRSFGADPELVARHAAAAVAGLQSAGVAACAKHFPGHGSTRTDSHDAIATVDAPMELLARRDLPPFAAAIAAGVRTVMPGHLRIPDLTGELPASLSRAAQTGLLRGELGFAGVIVSDALEMEAVSGPYGLPEAAVLAVAAGTDLLCFGRDQDRRAYLAVREALVTAAGEGRLPGERLEEAADRVMALRSWSAAQRQAIGLRATTESQPSGPVEITSQPGGLARVGGQADGPLEIANQVGAAVHGEDSGSRRNDREPGAASGSVTGLTGSMLAGPGGASGAAVGLDAARRALRVSGTPGALVRPVLLEVVPPANIAAGLVPWGLSAWLPPGAVERISAGTADSGDPMAGHGALAGNERLTGSDGHADHRSLAGNQTPAGNGGHADHGSLAGNQTPAGNDGHANHGTLAGNGRPTGENGHASSGAPADSGASASEGAEVRRVLALAAGRSLIIVIRDAHRYRAVRDLVSALLAARPDAVVVEMGLPVWRPPGELYLSSFGAARSSSQVVAEALGLTGPAADGRALVGLY
ncbi:MAG TPA: glycoside hydrolase family 3 N-terminal domain-containing protein [Streptosporangiaceae bacterium]